MDRKKIAVIDGNSWTHRAYHAVPPVMKLADGTPTNAVHGFMNMFLSFYEKAQPDAVICAFDAGIPQFRLEAVEQYKAQRKPMDNELRVQFPIVEELLRAMDVPVVKVDGWEGDDILGTISKKCEDLGIESLLVTGDKDANQLASNFTKIVNMKKGVSDVLILGPDEVYEKYGIRVDQFIDFLALMGDSSDNIPGVPGIGPKSATTLLQKFGSLDGVYENIDSLKGKQQENIKNNKESAYISKKAATIARDVPIDINLEQIIFPSFSKDKVSEVFLKYRMRSALTGILKLIGEEPDSIDDAQNTTTIAQNKNYNENIGQPPISKDAAPGIFYEDFKEDEEAESIFKQFCKSDSGFSISISFKEDDAPVQTSLFDEVDNTTCEYPEYKNLLLGISNGSKTAILQGDKAINSLIEVANSNCNCVCENLKSVLEVLYSNDTSKDSLISKDTLYNINWFDISLAAYLLNSSKSEYNAIDVWQQVFGQILQTVDANKESALKKTDEAYTEKKNKNIKLRLAQKACATYKVQDYLIELLKRCNLDSVYKDIEHPLTAILVDMQRVGAKVDLDKLHTLSLKTASLLEHLKSEILTLATEDFNIDSPMQLGHILFEVLGLPAKKKTKRGYSTDAEVLNDLSKIHPLPKKVIDYREYSKLKSTYIDALPALADNNQLIHTTFHQKVTTTGRLSSSDPNIQNIPTRSDFGNKIRECFIPHQNDNLILTADYSQIELRVLAHLSQDDGLIEAFNSGEDFHAYTAANVFGVSVDKVTSDMRRTAKAVNFGIVYGQQAYGLSQTLQISFGDAKEMIERYFTTYPKVRKYLDSVVENAVTNGYAQTMYGRRRYIPELNSTNQKFRGFGARTAMNHPMQGTAADIIKIAMINVGEELRNQKMKAKLTMQVHDELDFSVCNEEVEKLSVMVKDKMENAVKLDVPLVVDVAIGNNWAEAK